MDLHASEIEAVPVLEGVGLPGDAGVFCVVSGAADMGDRALFDQGLDATHVVPVVVREPDLGELQPMLVDGPKYRVRLGRVDHGSEPPLND
jgi:hypothetical protein